jgi:outer membrane protein assembly factor BamB
MVARVLPSRLHRRALVCTLVLLAAACGPADWPMFANDARHTGRSQDPGISGSNAASLGVLWQAHTGAAAYSSPVVATDPGGTRQVIVGSTNGAVLAFDAQTGERLWSALTGGPILATPAVANGVVYVGSNDHSLYAFDQRSGALRCTFPTGGEMLAPPVVIDPDGHGALVYFGDTGPTGFDDGGHVWAVNAADCGLRWAFSSFGEPPGSQPKAGSWSPPAFATDYFGRPMIVVGSSSPDDAVYSLDARTGARLWRYQTRAGFDTDVGAGPTISPPGANGFPHGVAYVANKNNIVYALDLTTGSKVWEFDIAVDSPKAGGAARSTAVLDGNQLYLGYGAGLYAFDATTGAKLWKTQDRGFATAEIIGAPAETGPTNDPVLFAGDHVGRFFAFKPATGAGLWSYQTGRTIYGSPAVANGVVYTTSADGFLYAFAPGGAPAGAPVTGIASPSDGSAVANPNGNLAVSGLAGDDTAVAQVTIALSDVNARKWWNAANATWSPTYVENRASLSNPGASGTGWSWSFPVPFDGGSYFAVAQAVDNTGRRAPTVASSRFAVDGLGFPPRAVITSPSANQTVVFPGGVQQSFNLTVAGNASDSGGTRRGIASVSAMVQNIEHGEYFCGKPGCNSFGTTPWVPDPVSFKATLASAGAATTNWSFVMPTYDHPHSYQVTVWATDLDGHVQQARSTLKFCIDTANSACS